MANYNKEVESGQRFKFGANWARFLSVLNEDRIVQAEQSLKSMLQMDNLNGHRFLDAGSGSGLFSLVARRLGAQVHSFDYDPESVACTSELKRRYFPGDENWTVESGSVLDRDYLNNLGKFDIVYSWGVLHHTGAMSEAMDSIVVPVSPGGTLFIALYNDQGWISDYWKIVKKIYNSSNLLKFLLISIHFPYLYLGRYLLRFLNGRTSLDRGMSLWHDMLDWLGGFPFEVATPEKVTLFYRKNGFTLENLRTCRGRHGCNEFVFRKSGSVHLNCNA